jgi:oligopeptide/dipeptide ABC transporter ATP-binding protein
VIGLATPVLEAKGLKKYFPIRKGVNVRAVDGVSFRLHEGEILGLVGESGSGKSTVAYTVVGMYRPTEGKLFFCGQDISKETKYRTLSQKGQMQIVFQDPGSSLNARRTVRQILELPIAIHGGLKTPGQREERIMDLLGQVELPSNYAGKYPASMGGGERQLVAIARALATNPSLVIFDEPTSALDVSVQAKVISRLVALHRKMNLSYLFITHDLSLMRNVSTRVAIMYLGTICEIASTGDFFTAPKHPYTHMLLSSIPVVSEKEEALKPHKVPSWGEIPSPVNVPPGCRFHTRCPECMDVCKREIPALHSVGESHSVACHAVST